MRLRLRRSRPAQAVREFTLTGSCPVREHTGDGHFVGRCEFATYDGVCPRHGRVEQFLGEDADLCGADDRKLPPRAERDFGPPELQEKLGVRR